MFTDRENGAESRRRVLVDGQSQRSVCREFDSPWDTLQKVLNHPEPPGYRRNAPRPRPKLEPFLPVIHQIREGDQKAPKKQRHTAQRIFERLRDEDGSTGGKTIVKEAVAAWKGTHAEVFAPLAHRPGEAQVDLGEAQVTLDGPPAKVTLVVRTLPYSDLTFCCVFPREGTAAVREGPIRTFAFLGGVPRRIGSDNRKIAGARITGGRGPEVTAEFLRLRSHPRFESHFGRVRRPNEKGHVATRVGDTRRNFLVPGPLVHGGREPLNADLEARCRADLQRRLWGKPTPKADRLEDERAACLARPGEAFLAARVELRSGDSLSLVRFDTQDSAVPTASAHHRVTVLGRIDTVAIVGGDRIGATHRRCWGRERVPSDPLHSLALRERKPGTRAFAAPLERGERPVCFGILRRRLEAEFGGPGRRQDIKVLPRRERASLRQLTRAVEQTLGLGTADADAVRLILEHRRERPVGRFCLDGRPP